MDQTIRETSMDAPTENTNQEDNQSEISQEDSQIEPTGEEEASENKFQQLLDEYEYERPKRGQVLDGEILWIDEDSIMVDIGQKRDGIIPIKDLSNVDDEYLENLSVGDKIPVYVTRTPVGDEDLVVSLDRGLEHETWDQAEQDMEEEKLLHLEIIGQNRGGLLVRYDSLQGFVPNSHIPTLYRSKNRQEAGQLKQEMIGDTLPVKVIEVNRQKQRLVFSARAAQKEQRKKRLEELEVGEIIHGEVVNIVDFGIFVDLNGVDGLVHKSKLAWKRVRHPSNLFEVGDEVDVKVIDVDVERERVSLSRKALLPNPWEELEQKYQPGDMVKGRITRVLDFGAFVELPEGVQGLIHTSEIGYSASHSAKEIVKAGETVLVRIINIDADRERISLSMRRVPVEQQLNWMLEGRFEEGQEEEAPEGAEGAEAEVEAEAEAETETKADAEPEAEVEAEAEDKVETEAQAAEQVEIEEEPEATAEAEEAVEAKQIMADAGTEEGEEPSAEVEAEPDEELEEAGETSSEEGEAKAEPETKADIEESQDQSAKMEVEALEEPGKTEEAKAETEPISEQSEETQEAQTSEIEAAEESITEALDEPEQATEGDESVESEEEITEPEASEETEEEGEQDKEPEGEKEA